MAFVVPSPSGSSGFTLPQVAPDFTMPLMVNVASGLSSAMPLRLTVHVPRLFVVPDAVAPVLQAPLTTAPDTTA
jgi:hypothetical protein